MDDHNIPDQKLCGYVCILLSISPSHNPNQIVHNAITQTLSIDSSRVGSELGFVTSNGVVLSLINSDGEGTSEQQRKVQKSEKKLRKLGLVQGSVSVVHQIQALVNSKCVEVVSRVVRVVTRDGGREVRAVVVVDVYLPIAVWSGWQFPRSKSTAAALFRHLRLCHDGMEWKGIVGATDATQCSKQQIMKSDHLMKALFEQKDGIITSVDSLPKHNMDSHKAQHDAGQILGQLRRREDR